MDPRIAAALHEYVRVQQQELLASERAYAEKLRLSGYTEEQAAPLIANHTHQNQLRLQSNMEAAARAFENESRGQETAASMSQGAVQRAGAPLRETQVLERLLRSREANRAAGQPNTYHQFFGTPR